MKRTYIQSNRIDDLTILDIASIATSLFFTSIIIFSAYLASESLYKEAFIGLILSSIYFTTYNALNSKWLQTGTWLVILGFAVKGVMGS